MTSRGRAPVRNGLPELRRSGSVDLDHRRPRASKIAPSLPRRRGDRRASAAGSVREGLRLCSAISFG